MTRSLLALCACSLLGAALAPAQHQHFEGFNWRERQTDHFTMRSSGTSHDPARRYAEKVWDECLRIMPGLEEDFTQNKFRTPGGSQGAEEAPYRFTVYLVGTGHDYDKILEQEQKRSGWDANMLRSCRITRNYGDPQNRYRVLCKADPNNTGGGGETDLTPVFVHGTASTILKGRCLSGNMPFWYTAGWGYYVEHRIFRLCRVHYIDFENYYKLNDKAEIKKGGVLGADQAWTSPIKSMCKKGVRESLNRVCNAKIINLTPNESGYIFALSYFLVSTDARIENFRKLIGESRDGQAVTKELLLKTYGYEDDAALEKDWYEFIESRDFK